MPETQNQNLSKEIDDNATLCFALRQAQLTLERVGGDPWLRRKLKWYWSFGISIAVTALIALQAELCED